jgi:hypothetical protein
MIEEALLVGLEGRARGALGVAVIGPAALAGDVGGFQRRGQIVVDDLEGAGVCTRRRNNRPLSGA